jgi:protein TonB
MNPSISFVPPKNTALPLTRIRRIGLLGPVILLHAGFFYALQSGLQRQPTQISPREVVASFINEQPAPKVEAPKPAPPAPKPQTVPVIKKKAAAPPKPVAPVMDTTPPQQLAAVPPAPAVFDPPAVETPAAPQVAEAPLPPKTISGVEYIQAPQPEYPPIAKRMGEEGKVMLRVLVNERGQPERVEVQKSSGSARLDDAARRGALRALFKPHLEGGKAIAVYALVPINFSIQ